MGKALLIAAGAMLAIAAAPGQSAPPASPAATGTGAGVYTEAQAAEGAAIFAERCAMCHGRNAEGTWEVPALRGKFMANWGHGSVAALSDYLARAMPQFAPGTLDMKDNVRLVAFLLKTNGHPAGARPLGEDHAALAAIRIDAVPMAAVK